MGLGRFLGGRYVEHCHHQAYRTRGNLVPWSLRRFPQGGSGEGLSLWRRIPSLWAVLSLFAGAGGAGPRLQGGFRFLGRFYPESPFRVVRAYDIAPRAVDTYNANLGSCAMGDVTAPDLASSQELPTVLPWEAPRQIIHFAQRRPPRRS